MIAAGDVIGGRYRLEQPIGEGGMATVWRAQHLALASPVAVKFMSVGPEASDMHERFLREARVAASVRHRNVIEITDFGTTADGVPYIVMELLEGQTLAERLQKGPPLSAGELVHIIALTLGGLAAVHDAGIVHRDLKPENIFLVRDADGMFPKMLDFGVSRSEEMQGRRLSNRPMMMGKPAQRGLTHEGMLIGTPEYMSAEQARGARDVDGRTDIYSIGVILYEGLAKKLPFEGQNIGELIMAITSATPPSLAVLRPDLPSSLVKAVERAMKRDRDDRFKDARDMRAALLEGLADMPQQIVELSGLMPLGGEGSSGSLRLDDPRAEAARAKRASADAPTDSLEFKAPSPTRFATESGRPMHPRRTIGASLLIVLLGAIACVVVLYQMGWPPFDDADEELALADGGTSLTPLSGQVQQLIDAGPAPSDAGGIVTIVDAMQPFVTVHLVGVPAPAAIRVDGEGMDGGVFALDRVDRLYQIEVTAPGYVPWRLAHPGTSDGVYVVTLEQYTFDAGGVAATTGADAGGAAFDGGGSTAPPVPAVDAGGGRPRVAPAPPHRRIRARRHVRRHRARHHRRRRRR